MTLDHHGDLIALWKATPGICIQEEDSKEGIARYLGRNPGLCFVAISGSQLVGSALCGHDGRRGYLQHVAVETGFQSRGVARQLVDRCFERLAQDGIRVCRLFALSDNLGGRRYWEKRGWRLRTD